MTDIRIVQNNFFPKYNVLMDWSLRSDGTLDDTQALATAVIVALGTDRLAEPNDPLPDPDSTNRRGWWGDLDAEEIWGGWPIGCRLWLLKRDKITESGAWQGPTTIKVEHFIREALQPLIDLKVASLLEVEVTRNGRERIDALVRLYRGPQVAVELSYQVLWSDIVPQSPYYDIGQSNP